MALHTDEYEQIDTLEPIGVAQPNKIAGVVQLKQSQRARKPSISNDFIMYLHEHEFSIQDDVILPLLMK